MYKLKPIFGVPIEIKSTCQMYKLKNVHKKAVQVFNNFDKVRRYCVQKIILVQVKRKTLLISDTNYNMCRRSL